MGLPETLPDMVQPTVRSVVLGVVVRDRRLLLFRGYDPAKRSGFWRPLGGGVEPGETAVEALRREMREEIGLDVQHAERIGRLENAFTYEGRPRRESLQVFHIPDVKQADLAVGGRGPIRFRESNGEEQTALWVSLDEVLESGIPLYPVGLAELLTSSGVLDPNPEPA